MEKIKYWLLFLFLLLIPSQLGKHFWWNWSSVLGMRIDYLSPTLYATDVLVGLMLLVEIIKNIFKSRQTRGSAPTKTCFWLVDKLNGRIHRSARTGVLWIIFLIINLIFAKNKFIAGYKILKIIEFLGLFFYVKNNKEIILDLLKKIIPMWIVLEVGLGLMQVFNNGSVQGAMYWLGERRISLNTIGVAKWTVFNQEILRIYGTFSHPNSLAGFLLVSVVWWSLLINKRNWNYWLIIILGIIGIVLTGSRTVVGVGVLCVIWNKSFVFRHSSKSTSFDKEAVLLILGIILFVIFFLKIFSGWDGESWNKRMELMKSAGEMFKNCPILGVGAGNFLSELPKYSSQNKIFWIQPVHNILILWIVEFGLIGLIWLIYLIKKINFKSKFLILPIIILLTGMNDHYWVTLQQNSLLMVLVLGVIQRGAITRQGGQARVART